MLEQLLTTFGKNRKAGNGDASRGSTDDTLARLKYIPKRGIRSNSDIYGTNERLDDYYAKNYKNAVIKEGDMCHDLKGVGGSDENSHGTPCSNDRHSSDDNDPFPRNRTIDVENTHSPSYKYGGGRAGMQCVNCGCYGHMYKTCNHPIISCGIICFKLVTDEQGMNYPLYLMIQRKDSLSYVEFMRGKYDLSNREYLIKLVSGMTQKERDMLCEYDFETLWNILWCKPVKPRASRQSVYNHIETASGSTDGGEKYTNYDTEISDIVLSKQRGRKSLDKYKPRNSTENRRLSSGSGSRNFNKEYRVAKKKFETLRSGYNMKTKEDGLIFINMDYIMEHSHCEFDETEWGFPKGRRNINELDVDCALREFYEETNIPTENMRLLYNIKPMEEVFTGSNKIRYKHVYYVAQCVPTYLVNGNGKLMSNEVMVSVDRNNVHQQKEIRDVQWFTYEEAQEKIRSTNMERKELFKRLHANILSKCMAQS